MFGKIEEYFPATKVIINPSYEWDERAKSFNVSHRELEVFALLMDGHDNKEIAHILGIQYQSVKNHLHSLYKKLKAKNMAQATKLLLFDNFIKTEYKDHPEFNYDRDKWIEHLKWVLDPKNYKVDKQQIEEAKKLLIEHGLYGELFQDRVKEIRDAIEGQSPSE